MTPRFDVLPIVGRRIVRWPWFEFTAINIAHK
jgi:hypothetical protein